MSIRKVSIIGLGYIGLPTAAVIASKEIEVAGIEINENVVEVINSGNIHIVEPGLDLLIKSVVDNGYLKAFNRPVPADVFIIAVPTPFEESSLKIPKPDISYIKSAVNSIAPVLKKGNLIVIESTIPVGTTEQIFKLIAELRPDFNLKFSEDMCPDINLAHCPERVLPGKILTELVDNDRVIGGISKFCSAKAIALYDIFVKGDCITTDARTAEMAKLTENSCRDVQIAFANELSILCDKFNIDVWELIDLANRHPRIDILQPGPGVGGHCIAVDPWFIAYSAPKESLLIQTARKINDEKPGFVVKKILAAIKEISSLNMIDPSKINICFFGITFKADVDDLRESPAKNIVNMISEKTECNIFIIEPNIKNIYDNKFIHIDAKEACEIGDLAVLLVDHKEFIDLDTSMFKSVIDTKGIASKKKDNYD